MFPTNDELFNLMILKGVTGGAVIEATATGNPLTFITDKAKPLKSLLIPFTPQQEGTGDPSPENIRPLLPWDGLTVFGGGKNILPDSAVTYGSYGIDGGAIQEGNNKYRRLSVNLPAGNYVFSTDTENCIIIRLLVDDVVVGAGGKAQSKKFTLTAPANVKIAWRNDTTTAITETLHNQLEVGQTATSYEPYHPITDTDIVFPSPVYGGEYEVVSGKLMDGWEVKVYDGSPDESWYLREDQTYGDTFYTEINGKKEGRGKSVCDAFANITDCWGASGQGEYGVFSDHPSLPWTFFRPPNNSVTTLNEWKAWLAENPIHCAYELATPQEIQLTLAQITALVGDNTIWSDADGSMTAVYLKKK